jgi:hypothetical protein
MGVAIFPGLELVGGYVRVVGFVVIILRTVGAMISGLVGQFENLLGFWFVQVATSV